MEKYTRLQLKMWTGRYWYNTYLRCWGNKKTKKMNQILTILLRNVRSSSNRLSVVVKEVKQGNRFSQPSPAALAARLLHAASILAKTRNDDKKAFWSHSGHVVWRVYVQRLWEGGGKAAASGSFLAVMANSVGSLTTTPKQTICHSPMFEWYTICMWTKHACHGAAAVAVDNGDYFRPPYNLRVER